MHILLQGIHFSIPACYGQMISDERSDNLSLCLTDGVVLLAARLC
jgi:hypothetical protein